MISVAKWSSPFHRESVGEFRAPAGPHAAVSEVLLLRLISLPGDTDPGAEVRELPAHVRDLRARHPGSPVAVWIAEAPLQVVADAARIAAGAQVRAILGGPAPDPAVLRAQLTH